MRGFASGPQEGQAWGPWLPVTLFDPGGTRPLMSWLRGDPGNRQVL